jgi:hypothetical protein
VIAGLSGCDRRNSIDQLEFIHELLNPGNDRTDKRLIAAENLDVLNLAARTNHNGQIDRPGLFITVIDRSLCSDSDYS